ncbi:hypothetical protein PCE1_003847 [Barthelona sp. PCE]
MPETKHIIALSFFAAVGLIIMIVSAAQSGCWHVLWTLLFGLFAAVPEFMCKDNESYGDDEIDGKRVGQWLTGFLFVGGFALPAILFISGAIADSQPFFISLIGCVCFYISVFIYLTYYSDDSGMGMF